LHQQADAAHVLALQRASITPSTASYFTFLSPAITTAWLGFLAAAPRTYSASSLLLTRRSALPRLRSRSASWPSPLTITSRGSVGGAEDLPTLGRSTLPVWMSGAVTMKITSSTSITSM